LRQDHEHGVALRHEVAHQRVRRREVEDVELHDPRGHDEQRLGQHGGRRRLVLDQLDEVVAVDHLARRQRDADAGLEALGARRRQPRGDDLRLAPQVHHAVDEVATAGGDGALQHLGVGEDAVGRRQHVQHLAGDELHDLLVLRRHAGHAGRGRMPPLLRRQEGAGQRGEGGLLPFCVGEALVVVEQRCGVAPREAEQLRAIGHPGALRLAQQRELLAG